MTTGGAFDLQIRNVSKTYGNGVKAMDNVSLTIKPGMFGLLGHNGAGKSTLMNSLATLQLPDAGSIHLGEVDILKDPATARTLIGYLPQEFGVYPGVPAVELLDYMAQLKGFRNPARRADIVKRLFHDVNLWDARTRSVDTYSGGMRQRFGVAQALIGDPRLLIVDEPTAGLDPTERNRLCEILAGISRECIVFLSTHIVEDVSTLCEDMAVMHNGRILGSGPPEEFIARLEGRIWIGDIETGAAKAMRAEQNVIATRVERGRMRVVIEAASAPAEGFQPKKPTLEDVFFSLTKSER